MSYQMRSVSFPARSQHPIILRIETELNKLQSWQHDHSISASSTMAEAVFFSLSRLEELHDCMDEILALPSTKNALSNNAQHSFLDSLLDASLKLLDVCSASRDAVLGIKEHVQDLQTTMRRRRAGVDTIVANGKPRSAAPELDQSCERCYTNQRFDLRVPADVRIQLDTELCRFGKEAYREGSSTLQTVNIIVDGMESSLERVFRCLIKTRASFLNIRSY